MRLPCWTALAVAVGVALGERSASACPACAAAGAGSPPWLVAALIAAPPAGFVVTALVVRRLARGPGR